MRAFFADGVDKLHIPWAVEGLPALLHLSLFLFFWGLLILLFNINHTVFCCVIWCIGVSLTMYGWITVVPIFRHDSPYYAPLSGSAWLLYSGILYTFFKVLEYIAYVGCYTPRTRLRFCTIQTYLRFGNSRNHYYTWIVGGVEEAAEETAWKRSSVIDLQILNWTLGTLGDDDLLEKFFEVIPGFFNSSLVKGLERDFSKLRSTFRWQLRRFLLRTLTSNSISDSVKSRRLIICVNAVDATDVSDVLSLISFRVEQEELSLPQSIETGHALAHWCTSTKSIIALPMRCIVSGILTAVTEYDDRWIALAKDQFRIPEHVLRDSIAHRDNSVLLSILIHLTRQALHTPYDYYSWPWNSLSTVSRFDICHTIPGLQNEFCTLWNGILQEARNEEARNRGYFSGPVLILKRIRHAYITLHQGTEAAPAAFSVSTHRYDGVLYEPSSYPLCTLASHRCHRLDSTPDGHHLAHAETQLLRAITTIDDISMISDSNPEPAAEQQAEELVITTLPTDLAITWTDSTSPHTQAFPSASPATEPVHMHIPSQVISLAANPSIVTHDLNPPIQIAVSYQSPQSMLSATDIVEPNNPMTDIHTSETRETRTSHAQAASASSPTFSHPDPILTIVAPAPSVTLSCPQESNKQQDTCPASRSTTAHFKEISSTTNPNSQHIPSYGATLPLHEDHETTDLCPIDSDSASLPIVIPASDSDVVPTEHPSSVESTPIRSDYTLHTPETLPSSSLATRSGLPSVSDAHVTTTIGAPSANDDLSAHGSNGGLSSSKPGSASIA